MVGRNTGDGGTDIEGGVVGLRDACNGDIGTFSGLVAVVVH